MCHEVHVFHAWLSFGAQDFFQSDCSVKTESVFQLSQNTDSPAEKKVTCKHWLENWIELNVMDYKQNFLFTSPLPHPRKNFYWGFQTDDDQLRFIPFITHEIIFFYTNKKKINEEI